MRKVARVLREGVVASDACAACMRLLEYLNLVAHKAVTAGMMRR